MSPYSNFIIHSQNTNGFHPTNNFYLEKFRAKMHFVVHVAILFGALLFLTASQWSEGVSALESQSGKGAAESANDGQESTDLSKKKAKIPLMKETDSK